MKSKEGKRKMSPARKRFLLNSAMFVALFGITASATYFIIPRQGSAENGDAFDEEEDDVEITTLTGRQRFIANLTSSATAGLNLKFDVLDAYFPGKDKSDETKGNEIDGKGTQVAFSMNGVSLHGIDLGLKANVDYNGYQRKLSVAKTGEDIYFSINDLNHDAYDFKYHASIQKKPTGLRDETTHGLIQYEYGDVDWIIDDVLEILSSGNIKVDFPSIDLSSLTGSSSSSGSDGSGSNATSEILNSLNEMEEDQANSYFVWNLPINGETLSIGLKHDEDYYLTGVDFPAKTFDGKDQQAFEIKNGDRLVGTVKASATVETGSEVLNWTDFIPGELADYREIVDSASLFRKIARYAANPQFGIKTTNSLNINSGDGLVLTHYSSEGGKATSEVLEQAALGLSGSADFNGGLQDFAADLSFSADNSYAKLSAAYLADSAYFNVDDLLMAKVSKTNLDALFAETSSALSETNDVDETLKEIDGIEDLTSSILDSLPTIKSFAEGHYEGAFDFISSIKGGDSNLAITFDLSPLSMEGEIVLTLDGTYKDKEEETDTYLSGIAFKGVKLSAFQLDGTLSLCAYSKPALDDDLYDELTHLPGVKDQIESITSSKEASLSLSGEVKTGKKDKVSQDCGVSFNGSVGFSYDKKEAGIKLTANQISENYSQDHHFSFALTGDGEDFKETAFRYDSQNDKEIDASSGLDEDGKARTNPRSDKPVTGKMSISSMQDIVSTIKGVIPKQEDDGETIFQKIAGTIGKLVGGDLASDLINQKYFGLFEKKVLAEKASLGGDSNVFVLNGSLFGMNENPKITVSYQANSESENGGLKDISFSSSKVSLKAGIEKTGDVEEAILNPLSGFDASSFTDFNTLKTLAEYAAGSTGLGQIASGDSSVYDLSLNLNLTIGKTKINLIGVSLHLANEKDFVKAHLSIPSMPLVKGVNAPDDPIYFRDHEYEGERAVDLYYSCEKGDEDYGSLYITRDSSYGRVTEVRDTVELKGKDLIEKTSDENGAYSYNGIGWLLEYVLGINESYLRKTNAPANEESESAKEEGASLFANSFPHPEDFLKEYQYDESKTAWSLGADVGSLLDERALLGDATIALSGANVSSSDSLSSWKTLSNLTVSFGLTLGDPDGSHQLVPASIEAVLNLDNVSGGTYVDTWTDKAVNDFTSVVSYENGEPVFAFGDEYTWHYSKTGEESLLPGNYYVGVTC